MAAHAVLSVLMGEKDKRYDIIPVTRSKCLLDVLSRECLFLQGMVSPISLNRLMIRKQKRIVSITSI
jgi:hypothetical protein